MELPKGPTVAVLEGAALNLFRNGGDGAVAKLTALETPKLSGDNKGSGTRHTGSSANPDDSRLEEDSFVAAVAGWLNAGVLGGSITALPSGRGLRDVILRAASAPLSIVFPLTLRAPASSAHREVSSSGASA